MKILMIGLGSIGQRHLRNLHAFLGDEARFLAYRVRGLQRTFSDTMQIREGVALEEEFGIQSYTDLDGALAQKPEIAYITNITSQHVPCAVKALRAGCDVFLEKPVADSMAGFEELYRVWQQEAQDRIVFVGFQNRYHPCLRRMKELLTARPLGPIISVRSEMGERLTTMHSYENYADTYMARRDQGGGVILNQQIHELDYLQWLFGAPAAVSACNGKNGTLALDVEDYNDALYWVESELGDFPISAHADLYQYPPRRSLKVICQNGWVEADLLHAALTVANGDDVMQETFPAFQRNQMFVDEMKGFLACVQTRKQNTLTLAEAAVSQRMAEAAKVAAKERRTVHLEEV